LEAGKTWDILDRLTGGKESGTEKVWGKTLKTDRGGGRGTFTRGVLKLRFHQACLKSKQERGEEDQRKGNIVKR